MILEKKPDVNVKDRYSKTALHLATSKGSILLVELLLQHGANIDSKDCWGWTALRDAAYGADEAVVRLLLGKTSGCG
jgi:ankyrin repeat domain-containing protein 50